MSDWHTFKLEFIEPPTKQQIRAMNRLVASDSDAPHFDGKPMRCRWRSPLINVHELLVEFDRLDVECKLSLRSDYGDGCCWHRIEAEWQYTSPVARAKDMLKTLSPEQRATLLEWLQRDEALIRSARSKSDWNHR